MGVYGDLIITYPKPYSVYLRGTITVQQQLCGFSGLQLQQVQLEVVGSPMGVVQGEAGVVHRVHDSRCGLKFRTLNPKPQTLNPKPQTLNPKP